MWCETLGNPKNVRYKRKNIAHSTLQVSTDDTKLKSHGGHHEATRSHIKHLHICICSHLSTASHHVST